MEYIKIINVNAIELGAVDTPMLHTWKTSEDTISRHYPRGQLTAREVAQIIMNMLQDHYKKMTGSVLRVDSGYMVTH